MYFQWPFTTLLATLHRALCCSSGTGDQEVAQFLECFRSFKTSVSTNSLKMSLPHRRWLWGAWASSSQCNRWVDEESLQLDKASQYADTGKHLGRLGCRITVTATVAVGQSYPTHSKHWGPGGVGYSYCAAMKAGYALYFVCILLQLGRQGFVEYVSWFLLLIWSICRQVATARIRTSPQLQLHVQPCRISLWSSLPICLLKFLCYFRWPASIGA